VFARGTVTAISSDGSVATLELDEPIDRIADDDDDDMIVLSDRRMIDGERRRVLVAFHVGSGDRLWQTDVAGYRSATIENGRLVLPRAREIVSIDLVTGEQTGEAAERAEVGAIADPAGEVADPSKAIAYPPEVLAALDTAMSRLLWTIDGLDHRDTFGVVDDVVIVVDLEPRSDS
jgi:hypothetical protein